MRIGLVDVDGHSFPNLCLMKISSYHKGMGDSVEWYEPHSGEFDKVYLSKVFSSEYTPDYDQPIHSHDIVKGGTGYAIVLGNGIEVYHPELDPPLPKEIETQYPDYSLYPQFTGYGRPLRFQTAYGFLTRGCPRGCSFCHVGKKEGLKSRKVASLDSFWNGQGNICLSDPNILACRQREELLKELISTKSKIDFNQGLDARLITPEIADSLASMRLKMPHFAMDRYDEMEPVKRGLNMYVQAYKEHHKGKWDWRYAKVFCLVNFDTTFEEDMERIKAIQECECWPYVMVYNKPSAPAILRRLQRWTNFPAAYASSKDFYEYQEHTYKRVLYKKE